MKYIYLTILSLFLLFASSGLSWAQQTETLFSGDVSHGGFGSFMYGVSSINDQAVFMRGTRGAWSLKFSGGHTIHIGLGGYRSHSGFEAVNWQRTDIPKPELRMDHGGFEIEYLNRSHRLIHAGIKATIGGGTVRYRDRNVELDKRSDDFFAFQPGANVHLNVTNWFRISGGIMYRYISGADLEGTNDSNLSGFSAFAGLRFGKF